jgi:hypothetical protein
VKEAAIRELAERFCKWQSPYGRPSLKQGGWVTPGPQISTQFHSPPFMAAALYAAYDALGEARYKACADRYVIAYLAAIREPLDGMQQDVHRPSYPFMYGMALAAFGLFREHNQDEDWFDQKADAFVGWLEQFIWDEGSYFRNGYGNGDFGAVDCGFSEDNLNIGRGLVAQWERTDDERALNHAIRLAGYYATDLRAGTYDGVWSKDLGTWAISPTTISSFEHFEGRPGCEIGWGFTSAGAVEYLVKVIPHAPTELAVTLSDRCRQATAWFFDTCQFEDGAVGLGGRDDRWLGMTAGAVLTYLRAREARILGDDGFRLLPKARQARDWLLANSTDENFDKGGYLPTTAQSEPRPPENLAWMLSWTLIALLREGELG